MYNDVMPSYTEIHNACQDIAKKFPNVNTVVGVSRGGLLPALILSHMLDKPLEVIKYSSKVGKGDNKNHNNALPTFTPEQGPILVVDDICDSGNTLNEILFQLRQQNIETYTAVLYYKSHDAQVMLPDAYWRAIPEDSCWVIFPFERNECLS